MTFFEAIAKCYRKYAAFKGRASKREFWWFVALVFLFAWPLLMAETSKGNGYAFLSLIYFLLTLSAVLPLLAAWSRRMHDVGKSGWTWLYLFIPIVGFFLVLRWATKDGDLGENKFGWPDNHSYTQASPEKTDEL